ncbi:YbhB/YbcL family Raf kinase inhibitor-like protein [Rhabdothermincola sediminis]|uniref:YbhB/YbcL family Raf kinase inhibitor-like protein n=1 Tax=Rhabdothermincola sediminis TaxID=2751370 RepID=UPI001AA06508|nr:YbhB/YbcL family Raf kinase inhibitor-like protein [Rhabdothermincola sediminis]
MPTRNVTRTVAVALAVLIALATSSCGSSGRELRDPAPGATAPPRRPAPAGTLGSSTTLGTVFALTTDAWAPGAVIPERYTCDGTNVSPPLVISQIPPGTAELAIVVTDADANDFVHWVLAGIPPSTTAIEEGTVPSGAVQASTSARTVGWFGPCPPPGSTHHYDFVLYALAAPSGVVEGQDPARAIDIIERAPQAAPPAVMTGTYER